VARGNNISLGYTVGWKIDMNGHMARYTLLLWEAVLQVSMRLKKYKLRLLIITGRLQHEGLNRSDWFNAAQLSAQWIYRMAADQVATYGGCTGPIGCAGFPQCIVAPDDAPTPSVVSGRDHECSTCLPGQCPQSAHCLSEVCKCFVTQRLLGDTSTYNYSALLAGAESWLVSGPEGLLYFSGQ